MNLLPRLASTAFTALALIAGATGFVVSSAASATAQPGQPAPAFQLKDVEGKPVSLADHAGKVVVIEWVNPNCPFVQKHYDSKNMQSLQSRYGGAGVVWLSINSTRPDHPDYHEPAKLAAWTRDVKAAPRATLMDADGKVGRLYGARTTPHMFVVDPAGKVVYAGAIDDKRSASAADIKTSKNYVAAALDEVRAGKPVTVATSQPYGCSVKYQ